MKCINLKESFGDVFKVEHEESHGGKTSDDPWLMILPCQHGNIYPHGGDELGASTSKNGKIATQLRNTPGVTVQQDGNDGVNVTFNPDLFSRVAQIMKPHRRRKLSRDHRQTLDAASRSTRFEPVLSPKKRAIRGLLEPDMAQKTSSRDRAVKRSEKASGNRGSDG